MVTDIDSLLAWIARGYAYADRHPEVRLELAVLRDSLPESATTASFAMLLQEILAHYQDGHTGVRHISRFMGEAGSLPFSFVAWQGHVVVRALGTDLAVDASHPFLRSVNGVLVGELLQASSRPIAFANPATAFGLATERLRYAPFLLRRMGLRTDQRITLDLSDTLGHVRTIEAEVIQAEADAEEDDAPYAFSLIEGSIGYLRIPSFSRRPEEEELDELMKGIATTEALVIDVRGNRGGSRSFLVRLLPFFIDGPLVVNAARYRTDARTHPVDGYLIDRYVFLPGSSFFNAEQEMAITQFKEVFRPAWSPPEEKFSPWHYMVITPGDGPHYRKPVIVLQDERCFSATDVFCSAFAQLPQVVLMGTTTGGGSGRPVEHELPSSHLRVRLSSMVSFRANGELFEGAGVPPDIMVPAALTDALLGSDTMLQAAIEHIRGRTP